MAHLVHVQNLLIVHCIVQEADLFADDLIPGPQCVSQFKCRNAVAT